MTIENQNEEDLVEVEIEQLSYKQEQMAIMAAEHSKKWGPVLPDSRNYNLPPMLTREEMMDMPSQDLKALLSSAKWHNSIHADIALNLDHPDVKAVL